LSLRLAKKRIAKGLGKGVKNAFGQKTKRLAHHKGCLRVKKGPKVTGRAAGHIGVIGEERVERKAQGVA